MIPTWRELAQRIAWLCYQQYRQIRRAWRHHRVAKRLPVATRLIDRITSGEIGAPIRIPNPHDWAPIVMTSNQRIIVSDCYFDSEPPGFRDMQSAAAKIRSALMDHGLAS